MKISRALRLRPFSLLVLSLAPIVACSDSGTGPAPRSIAAVDVALAHTEIEVGQADTATAVARDQFGAPITGAVITWSSTFPQVAIVNAATGEITAVASGNAEIVGTAGNVVGRQRITVSPPPLLINEVNPNGDLPGGFVEIYNPTPHAVDMAGWVVTGGNRANAFTLPDGVVIGSGEYVAVNEVTVPNEFHATDAVHLYSKFGVQADAYAWAGNVPGTAYARCPNGSGNFTNTATPTRKAANACP